MKKLFICSQNREVLNLLIVALISSIASVYYILVGIPFTILCIVLILISRTRLDYEIKFKFLPILLMGLLTGAMGIKGGIILDTLMELMNLPIPPYSPPTIYHLSAILTGVILISTFYEGISYKSKEKLKIIVASFISLFAGTMIIGSVIIDFIEAGYKVDV